MVYDKYDIPDGDRVITRTDMAALLGVSIRTLIRWDKDNKLNSRRKPNGQPYYLKSDYYDYHHDSKIRGENYHV